MSAKAKRLANSLRAMSAGGGVISELINGLEAEVAAAHASGFAAGKEAAAKVADAHADELNGPLTCLSVSDFAPAQDAATLIAAAIRALPLPVREGRK